MAVRICHKCQKVLAEDFMTSDDGWFFCSSCWEMNRPDEQAAESQAEEARMMSKKAIGLIMLIIIPIFLILFIFALTLLAELDLDLLAELGLNKDQIQAPRIEDYDLDDAPRSEAWTGDPRTDANAILMYSTYRLMVPGSTRANPVGTVVVSVIKNHKGEEGNPFVLNNQIYHIQSQSVYGNIKCAIKKGHMGDGVFYHNDKLRKYNTGIIIREPQ